MGPESAVSPKLIRRREAMTTKITYTSVLYGFFMGFFVCLVERFSRGQSQYVAEISKRLLLTSSVAPFLALAAKHNTVPLSFVFLWELKSGPIERFVIRRHRVFRRDGSEVVQRLVQRQRGRINVRKTSVRVQRAVICAFGRWGECVVIPFGQRREKWGEVKDGGRWGCERGGVELGELVRVANRGGNLLRC